MKIRSAATEDAAALTQIAHDAKRYWGYPEHWLEHWQTISRFPLITSPATKKRTLPVRDWKAALNRFAIVYENRLPLGD